MVRPTLSEARAQFQHRFTMEHVPQWAKEQCGNGKFYAPQFRSDAEWYANTIFPGEKGHPEFPRKAEYCHTVGQTWPIGKWLDKPYTLKG